MNAPVRFALRIRASDLATRSKRSDSAVLAASHSRSSWRLARRSSRFVAWHSAGHPHRAHVRAPGTKTVDDETVEFKRSSPRVRRTRPFGEEEEEEESDVSPGASTSSARRFRTFSSYARYASNAENPTPAVEFEPATFEPACRGPTLFSGRRYGSGGVPGDVPTATPASQSAMDANAKHGATTPQTEPEPSPGFEPPPGSEPAPPAPLLRHVLHGPLATPEKSTDPIRSLVDAFKIPASSSAPKTSSACSAADSARSSSPYGSPPWNSS